MEEVIFSHRVLSANIILISDSKNPSTQQSFKKEPVSISAAVGSEVTLQCEVENQFGPVQWTKDGFALGKKYVKRFSYFV